jgi:uncharacterized protein YbbK (DUF523 family)
VGRACRWDGASSERTAIVKLYTERGGVLACPEELGGLPTPRTPATLTGGDGEAVLDSAACVVDRDGRDVTDLFLQGARRTLVMARQAGAVRAYLKKGSPSCGCAGTNIDFHRAEGRGVTAALLARSGIEVVEVE